MLKYVSLPGPKIGVFPGYNRKPKDPAKEFIQLIIIVRIMSLPCNSIAEFRFLKTFLTCTAF